MSVSVKINIRDMFWVSVLALGAYVFGMLVQFLMLNPLPSTRSESIEMNYPNYIPLRLLCFSVIVTMVAIRYITIVDGCRESNREFVIGMITFFGWIICWIGAFFYGILRLDDFLNVDRVLVWNVGGLVGFVFLIVMVEVLIVAGIREW